MNDEIDYSAEAYNIYGIEKIDNKKPELDQMLDLVHPKDREFVHEKIEHILNGKGFEEFQHRLITPNGTEKHVVQRGDVEYDANNDAIKVFGTVSGYH